ncbi:MAG: Holliday junction resolvase RuvX, partial [Acidimicrobiales bacterium]
MNVIAPEGRVLGVDLGSRRIGVAVSDSGQSVATGVCAVRRSAAAGATPLTAGQAADHQALAALVEEYSAVGVVVGVPLSMSGATGPAASAALAEVDHLRRVLPAVPVDTADERLTTVAASGALHSGGARRRRRREVVDQTAAAVILQGWLDRRRALT